MIPLTDYARLETGARDALASAISDHTTLERALHWARTLTPPRGVEAVLTQDEYTHDVLIPYGSRYLAYDTS